MPALRLTLLLAVLGGCAHAPVVPHTPADVHAIQPVTLPDGLVYYVTRPGTGPAPAVGDTVAVHYTGWLTDGTQFDSSVDRGTPLEFSVGTGAVIKGWDEGVLTMHVGEKRQLRIPSALGYGAGGAGPIPPNSILVFDVELVSIKGK